MPRLLKTNKLLLCLALYPSLSYAEAQHIQDAITALRDAGGTKIHLWYEANIADNDLKSVQADLKKFNAGKISYRYGFIYPVWRFVDDNLMPSTADHAIRSYLGKQKAFHQVLGNGSVVYEMID
jgi:hypothetical protein